MLHPSKEMNISLSVVPKYMSILVLLNFVHGYVQLASSAPPSPSDPSHVAGPPFPEHLPRGGGVGGAVGG